VLSFLDLCFFVLGFLYHHPGPRYGLPAILSPTFVLLMAGGAFMPDLHDADLLVAVDCV